MRNRVVCFFLGHEKWSFLDGAWFCMRCPGLKLTDESKADLAMLRRVLASRQPRRAHRGPLRILFPQGSAGSNPASGTKLIHY